MKNNLQIIENKIKYTYEPLEEIFIDISEISSSFVSAVSVSFRLSFHAISVPLFFMLLAALKIRTDFRNRISHYYLLIKKGTSENGYKLIILNSGLCSFNKVAIITPVKPTPYYLYYFHF